MTGVMQGSHLQGRDTNSKMSENEYADAVDDTAEISYGAIFRHLHGTNTEAMIEGFAEMFNVTGIDPGSIESRVRSAVLERFGTTMESAGTAESMWNAVDETRSDRRIDQIVNEASCSRIALPPPQLLDKLDGVTPGTSKRVIDRGSNLRDAARKTEDDVIAGRHTIRLVAQGIGLSVLLFSLLLSLAFATLGEPLLSSASLSIAGITYLAKIKTRVWSRNRRNHNLEIASRLLRQASRHLVMQER